MDLDWCIDSDSEILNTSQFNENSVISKNKKISNEVQINSNILIKNDTSVEKCFCQNLEIKEQKDLLNILNYLSIVSNYLRTLIRNKSFKNNESNLITKIEFESLLNYLEWLKKSCNIIKEYFAIPLRRDNSYDPNNIKLFKTSSYKFCNFKESCSIHRTKNKSCDKNHYVFDMIINDIDKLIESIKLLELDNFNWVICNKLILVKFINEDKSYQINKLNLNIIDIEQSEYQFIIDKSLIFKSFDVISYVLNKMYEESYSFLNFNTQSLLINF